MIHSDCSSFDLDPIKVVNGQHCAPLVFIAEETEALGLPRPLVSHQMDVNDLPVLGEHTDDVALRQCIRKPAQEDPGAALVHGMPRHGTSFAFTQLSNQLDLR